MKYIALLRGINVGGNNKVAMIELKACFESLGFRDVRTYINSGNVIFQTHASSLPAITTRCEEAIETMFGFHVTCLVIRARDLHDALTHAPEWWDHTPDSSNNALFVIAPATADDVIHAIGEVREEYERVEAYGSIIFWAAPRATIGRTRYSKLPGTLVYRSVTIRNANTTRKLAQLSQ